MGFSVRSRQRCEKTRSSPVDFGSAWDWAGKQPVACHFSPLDPSGCVPSHASESMHLAWRAWVRGTFLDRSLRKFTYLSDISDMSWKKQIVSLEEDFILVYQRLNILNIYSSAHISNIPIPRRFTSCLSKSSPECNTANAIKWWQSNFKLTSYKFILGLREKHSLMGGNLNNTQIDG